MFRQRLGVDRDVVRTVLLDQKPDAGQEIPTVDPDVRVSWGDYLHKVTFEQWAAEHLTNFNSWVKFIHTKIILVDPLGAAPVTLTGSANYSDNSTTDNEENTVVIRGDGTAAGDAAARRVADIYLTEYQRLFMHFVFRDWAAKDADAGEGGGILAEDDTWTARYYQPGGWRAPASARRSRRRWPDPAGPGALRRARRGVRQVCGSRGAVHLRVPHRQDAGAGCASRSRRAASRTARRPNRFGAGGQVERRAAEQPRRLRVVRVPGRLVHDELQRRQPQRPSRSGA